MKGFARHGFALPMALLLLLVTSGAVFTTLNLGSIERKVLDNESSALDALVLAEAGLERFSTQHKTPGFFEIGTLAFPDVVYDSARIDLGAQGGYADVVVERVRAETAGTPALYFIRSRGVKAQGGWAGAPRSVRVVTRLAQWIPGSLDVHSAWTGIGGLEKNGVAGSISGMDHCGVEPSVAGIAVPEDPGYSGDTAPIDGDPKVDYIGATVAEAADAVQIDWDAIVNGTAVTPEYTIPGDSWEDIDFSGWPVIYVDNPSAEFTLPSSGGRGTLIVRGDMEIDGSYLWDGVILAGGALRSNGNNAVYGATISGLNAKLGETVGLGDLGNGTKTFAYHSCNVRDAMKASGSMRVMENTWFDVWSMY